MRKIMLIVLGFPALAVQAAGTPTPNGTTTAVVETAAPVDTTTGTATPSPTDVDVAVPATAPIESAAAPILDAAPAPVDLPPMDFSSSVAADPLFAKIRAVPAFSRAEQELPGSPIRLRVTHALLPTAGGQAAGFLSAIVAGGTLGLLPVVTNNNLVLTYEVSVNGKPLLRRDFERAFTRAENIWTAKDDPTYGLGEDGLAWAIETATQFATDAAGHPALAELSREYDFYFAAGG